MMACYLHTDK